jgi:hypothetical protein
MLVYEDPEVMRESFRRMTPLEERHGEIDYMMFENRETCSEGQYLDWHLEKEKIRILLEGDRK